MSMDNSGSCPNGSLPHFLASAKLIPFSVILICKIYNVLQYLNVTEIFLAVGISVWDGAISQDHPGALCPGPDWEVNDGNVGRHVLTDLSLISGSGDLLIFITDHQGGKCTDTRTHQTVPGCLG